MAIVVTGQPVPSGAAPYACPPADSVLEGRPSQLGAPTTLTMPDRVEGDGSHTLTLNVEDPVDAPSAYRYTTVPQLSSRIPALPPQVAGPVQSIGVFSHQWSFMPASRPMVTHGLFVIVNGIRYRVPLFITENAASSDLVSAALALALQEANPLHANGSGYALNTLMPTPLMVVSLLPLAAAVPPLLAGQVPESAPYGALALNTIFQTGNAWTFYLNQYPSFSGYQDVKPVYIWTTFRNAPGNDVWAGSVVTHNGGSQTIGGTREACRRTRIGIVHRTGATTAIDGGVYILDKVKGVNAPNGDFTGTQELTAGLMAAGRDVPVSRVNQSTSKKGAGPFGGTVYYPKTQDDEITIGVVTQNPLGGETFTPLIGTKAHTEHAAPPNAQTRLISLGVFDPTGDYHPVVGVREHFELLPQDLWIVLWALGGGPGNQGVGDWQIDIGTFDPFENFVPLWGAQYADQFPEALYPSQMMLSMGPWAATTFQPAIGISYDGLDPLVNWALANVGGAYSSMRRWFVATGSFLPTGCANTPSGGRRCPFVPAAGASYFPGTPQAIYDSHPIVEEYRVGVYPGSYSTGSPKRTQFIPVAGVRWSSGMTSAAWAAATGTGATKFPVSARLDAGAVTPNTGHEGPLMPVAGARMTAGRPDFVDVGVWTLGAFRPVAGVCNSSATATTRPAVGVSVFPSGTRVPLVWAGVIVGPPPTPVYGTSSNCPA